MTRSQLEADRGESRPNLRTPPDDSRKPISLHRTSGRERQHRDRGMARDSDKWREHVRRDAD